MQLMEELVRAVSATPVRSHVPRGRPIFRALPGETIREFHAYIPVNADARSKIVVLVHGISTNAAEHIVRFAREADRHGVILIAPLFDRAVYGKYQQVIDRRLGIRSDLALFDIVSWISAQTGASGQKFNLFGFSGGSQFAHRFAMLHPHRVLSCVCASAGWYTFPDPRRSYPQGIKTHPLGDGKFDPDAIRAVPFHVLVGERDIAVDNSLRSTPGLVARQGITRVERAQRWFSAMQEWALHPASTLSYIPKAGHRFGNAARRRHLASLVFARFNLAQ